MRRATIAGLAVALVSILPAHSQTAEAAAPNIAQAEPPSPQVLRALRVAKASYIVSRLYHYGDKRDFLPYVNALVNEHEYLKAYAVSKGRPGQGYGAAYYWSLVYGGANFGLQCYTTAPGRCVGPLDVKGKPGSMEPLRNISYHCQEMLEGYLRGYRDRGLCEYVMQPRNPHDWGGGMFRRTDARFRRLLAEGYASGAVQ
ncbi:MAG TPA: hypothetical protein VMW48_10715 [Vicinamibacterales bacterium]|nr:hypothetical protein [Vicinamibacterales bacterium]